MPTPPDSPASVRLDLWLWAARFFKTRALAKQAIETGKVEVGGQRAKPSRSVRPGDALVIQRGEERFHVEVAGLSDVRGPAKVAQSLYVESEASRAAASRPAPPAPPSAPATARRRPGRTSVRAG